MALTMEVAGMRIDHFKDLHKLYCPTYTLLVDKLNKVVQAMGSDEWIDDYEPYGLMERDTFETWTLRDLRWNGR